MLLGALGCHQEATIPASHPRVSLAKRLVEPETRRGALAVPADLVTWDPGAFPTQTSAAAHLPRVRIGDDSRPVLAAPERGLLAYRAVGRVGENGRVALELPVGGPLASASEIVVVPHLRTRDRETWQAPNPVLARTEQRGDRITVAVDIAAGAPAGAAIELNAVGLRTVGETTLYETAPLLIPERGQLDLSLGILEVASGQGAVRFVAEACEKERCSELFEETLDPSIPTGRLWNDRTLDLSELAGTTRTLRFRTHRLGPKGGFSFPVWADPVLVVPEIAPDPRPNFVLVSIDTLRRDHLDVYGYPRETAPFLRDHFGSGGVVFDGLVAEAATTDPSHMTMFTSLPASVHGVTRDLIGLEVPVTTLAERLREEGYRTAAITENGPLAHDRGFSIGFDRYRENKSESFVLPAGHVEDTFEQARDWLMRNGNRRFFLFLHTFQVHAPYRPPKRYGDLFDDDLRPELTAEQRRTIADYDREIRYVDDQLSALMRWNEKQGLTENTIWIVLSDHGEEFWEHGSLGHLTLPYETVLRVPLLVRGPGVARAERRDHPIHHLDIMPTILELAGAAIPPEAQGRSFAALLREDAPATSSRPTRPLASASWMLPAPLDAPARAVRIGSEKLMRLRDPSGSSDRFFDLSADPGERKPADEGPPDLGKALAVIEEDASTLRTELAARAAAADRAAKPSPAELDPAREQMLRALGYIE